MAVSCPDKKKRNLGLNRCKTMPAMPKTMYITPPSFEATDEEITDPAFWQAAMLADPSIRVYPFPLFKMFENVSEEAIYEDTPLSYEPVRDGQYRFRFSISDGICTHTAMFTHRGSAGDRVWIQDINNNVWVTEKANGNYAGLTLATLNTEKFVISDGSVTTKSPVLVALADNTELDQNGFIFNGAFLLQLDRLTDVEITLVGAAAADEIDVTVTNACDGTEVLGLLTADWIYINTATGATVPVTSTYANGVYTIAGTLVDGTLTLRAPSLLTVKAYEALAPLVVNVP